MTVEGETFAATAEKAAIQALKDLSKEDKPMRWSNELTPEEQQQAQCEQEARGFWYDTDVMHVPDGTRAG